MGNTEKTANEMIGIMIRDAALYLGYKEFFRNHVCTWDEGKKDGEGLRDFAKRVTLPLPDWCSFDAFFDFFMLRFVDWYETGDVDGIIDDTEDMEDDPEEE